MGSRSLFITSTRAIAAQGKGVCQGVCIGQKRNAVEPLLTATPEKRPLTLGPDHIPIRIVHKNPCFAATSLFRTIGHTSASCLHVFHTEKPLTTARVSRSQPVQATNFARNQLQPIHSTFLLLVCSFANQRCIHSHDLICMELSDTRPTSILWPKILVLTSVHKARQILFARSF